MERAEPKVRWELSEADRVFLLIQGIDPEEDFTPYPEVNAQDEVDGA